jgi:hypothetical protein
MRLKRVEHAGAAIAPPVWRLYRCHPVAGPDVGACPRPPRAPFPRETTTATTISAPSETVLGVSRGTNGWRPTSGQEKESYNRCAC